MKKISVTKTTAPEAMREIDTLMELNQKERNCLRLLTEEMFSMIRELLKEEKLDFEVSGENGSYRLGVSVKTRVGFEARNEFLSMTSDGRNAADKGVKGVIGFIIESFARGDEANVRCDPWMFGMLPESDSYLHLWTLTQYMATAPQEQSEKAWDGLEKSIIANFADDVMIGVRTGWIDMTVLKSFA